MSTSLLLSKPPVDFDTIDKYIVYLQDVKVVFDGF